MTYTVWHRSKNGGRLVESGRHRTRLAAHAQARKLAKKGYSGTVTVSGESKGKPWSFSASKAKPRKTVRKKKSCGSRR